MKLSIVAIALALVCFVSFVLAADQPVTMTTPMSEAGRMQLAKAIKEAISRNPSAVDPAVAAMSTEDIFSTLTNLATNPAVLTNTAGLVASLATGNTPGIATNAAGLTAAVTPVLVSAFTPAPASEAALAAARAS